MFEIGSALQFLRDKNVLHCDIKTLNTLIINGRAVIADMGIAAYNDVRIEACETITGRAPELIEFDYMVKFQYENGVKRNGKSMYNKIMINTTKLRNTYVQGELWSYGIICLDILYNKLSLMWTGTNDRLVDTLHDFSLAEDKQKFLFDKYGVLPDDHLPIFNEIISKLLIFNPQQRIKTFSEFLSIDIFTNKNLIYNPNIGDLTFSEQSGVISKFSGIYRVVNDWICEVLAEFELPNRVAFLALTLIRDLWDAYNIDSKKAQLFGAACVYLASMVLNDSVDLAYELEYISNHQIKEHDIQVLAFEILEKENGAISKPTIYDYLSSEAMLVEALKTIYKNPKFAKSSSKDIADEILLSETVKEANNITLKWDVSFADIFHIVTNQA
jgi:hypothetical protein